MTRRADVAARLPRKAIAYVHSVKDKTGFWRHYFRRTGVPRIALPGQPGEVAFRLAYEEAMGLYCPEKKVHRPPLASGQIYLVKRGSLVKIGFSKKLSNRMRGLELAGGVKLILLASAPGEPEDERRLHRLFAAYREIGEWFRIEGGLKKFLDHPACNLRDAIRK